ncbi:MAG: hypothetical protein MRY57_02050 [Candidatus Pacebacteria bacterium]|nr:hypothetical protein [Candidatus Paceibacterota bacterium]
MEPYFNVQSFIQSFPKTLDWFYYPPGAGNSSDPEEQCAPNNSQYLIGFSAVDPAVSSSTGSYGDVDNALIVDRYFVKEDYLSNNLHCHTP